jgi:hypothetical protein
MSVAPEVVERDYRKTILTARETYRHVIMAGTFLPEDESGKANIIRADYDAGLIDRVEAMRRRGLTDKEIFGYDPNDGRILIPDKFVSGGILRRVQAEERAERKNRITEQVEVTEARTASTSKSRQTQPASGNNRPPAPGTT